MENIYELILGLARSSSVKFIAVRSSGSAISEHGLWRHQWVGLWKMFTWINSGSHKKYSYPTSNTFKERCFVTKFVYGVINGRGFWKIFYMFKLGSYKNISVKFYVLGPPTCTFIFNSHFNFWNSHFIFQLALLICNSCISFVKIQLATHNS